jgi:predicted ATPase/class 3 adenylate cyclase/predicted Ser/Thr protein kinase
MRQLATVRLAPGAMLAGYRVEHELGRGGMGVVYRATQVALDRPVALKLIAPELAADAAFRERFKREAKLAASIEHPNVLPVHEAGEIDGILFVSVRFVEGHDASELVREGSVEPARALAVVRGVASALDAAHERGLVHRDVKPQNVLIEPRGDGECAYLTDFGLAKLAVGEAGLTATGMLLGTVDYAAPEVIRGEPVDGRADVYSLGCLLYELLIGEVPFPREHEVARLWAHVHDEPPSLSDRRPGLPRPIDAVVARALAKQAGDRFASAGGLADAAAHALAGLQGESHAPSRQVVSTAAPSGKRRLPTGTVTLLATDIEGSTQLLAELGSEAYAAALAEHRRAVREAVTAHAGVEVDTQGDAFLIAFARATDAAAAAEATQRALANGAVRVRMGLHSGEPLLTDEGYVGIDVHQAARVMSAGHGGQTLVSETTAALLGADVPLRDLGAHRLKDLTSAQRLYQLGDGDFSSLKALHETNLPVQPTPLVGREHELAEVLKLLSASRLVTLTGSGGSGKTRLALQAAAELVNDYEGGVWWVSLALLSDPGLVESTIAQVVGARDSLAEHLRGQKALLLLDNFEHLLAAAPRIGALLSEAPEVRVLATSRERLGIAAEQEYPVPTMVSAEAVALLTARARQLKPDFEPNDDVVEICRRLDGLPLAIELAAARVKVLAPDQLLARLGQSLDLLTAGTRDAPERQQTLRVTIDWSHQLLDADDQQLFARLAVFAGSYSLEAAEAVCDAEIDTLAALADKSLLRRTDEGRFFMLETIREYALERLEASGAAPALRRRHTEYFLGRADQFAAASAAGQSEALVWLGDEYAEHRAALGFLQQSGDYERLARLAVSLRRFWELRGYLREGLSWLEAVAGAAADAPRPLHASALQAAAILACRLGQLRQADELSEAAYELSQAMGDVDGRMLALNTRALAAVGAHDYDRARAFSEEQATLAREHGQDRPLGAALDNLSYVARARGDHEEAIRLSEEALEIFRKVSDSYLVGVCLVNLGASLVERHEVRDARVFLDEAIGLFVGLEHWEGVAAGLVAFAAAAEEREAHEASATLLAAADSLLTDVGASGIDGGLRQRTLDKTRDGLDDRSFETAWADGSAMEVAAAVDFALASID